MALSKLVCAHLIIDPKKHKGELDSIYLVKWRPFITEHIKEYLEEIANTILY